MAAILADANEGLQGPGVAGATDYSACAWFHASALPAGGTWRSFIYRGDDVNDLSWLGQGSTGLAEFSALNAGLSLASAAAMPTRWHGWRHVAKTYTHSTGTHRVYIDGALVASGVQALTSNANPFTQFGTYFNDAATWDPVKVAYARQWPGVVLTATQIKAERLSLTAVVAVGAGGFDCPLLADLIDVSGNGNHLANAYGTATFGTGPGFADELVYELDFSRGQGSIATDRVLAYASTAWSGGADAPDTVYPECRIAEDSLVNLGDGPAGENTISHKSNIANGAFFVEDIGWLTSPVGSVGWMNGTQGRARIDIKLDAAFYAAAVLDPVVILLAPTLNKVLRVELNRVSAGLYNLHVVAQLSTGTLDTYDTGSALVASISTPLGFTGWLKVRVRWQCGTVTGDFASVAADGFITVDVKQTGGEFVRMFTASGIRLMLNQGNDNNQADSVASVTYSGTAVANWIRAIALGYYGLTKSTNLRVYNVADPVDDPDDDEDEGGGGEDDGDVGDTSGSPIVGDSTGTGGDVAGETGAPIAGSGARRCYGRRAPWRNA